MCGKISENQSFSGSKGCDRAAPYGDRAGSDVLPLSAADGMGKNKRENRYRLEADIPYS